jgi:hypothetical protein
MNKDCDKLRLKSFDSRGIRANTDASGRMYVQIGELTLHFF